VIVAYLDAYPDRLGVEPICQVLCEHGMKNAPSTSYAVVTTPASAAVLAEAYLVNAPWT
jgi:putative transposase